MDKRRVILYLALVAPWIIAAAMFVIGYYFGKWHATHYDMLVLDDFDGDSYDIEYNEPRYDYPSYEDVSAYLRYHVGHRYPGTTVELHDYVVDGGSITARYEWDNGTESGADSTTFALSRE